jgi:ribosomal protein S18 acetylase RimI-like enzyme
MSEVPDVVIRRPQPGDGAGVARAWIDAGLYYAEISPKLFQVPPADGLTDWIEQWLLTGHSESTLLQVAETAGEVVGCIVVVLHQPMESASRQLIRELGLVRVEIELLVVAEAYRRQGIGTRLMQAAEAWARNKGAVVALLNTYVDSPLSVPFYEDRLGYRRRALRFRKDLA